MAEARKSVVVGEGRDDSVTLRTGRDSVVDIVR